MAGNVIARSASVARRLAALAGFLAVIVLAVMLLYRVYVHHSEAEEYVDDDAGAIVFLRSLPEVKIASGPV